VSDGLLERLDSYPAREGRSRSDVVREAIERYLDATRQAGLDRLIVTPTRTVDRRSMDRADDRRGALANRSEAWRIGHSEGGSVAADW
jgi:predicted DNA-binding protein